MVARTTPPRNNTKDDVRNRQETGDGCIKTVLNNREPVYVAPLMVETQTKRRACATNRRIGIPGRPCLNRVYEWCIESNLRIHFVQFGRDSSACSLRGDVLDADGGKSLVSVSLRR
jgi:hypothetical protein